MMSRNEIGVLKLATEFECRYCLDAVSILLIVVVCSDVWFWVSIPCVAELDIAMWKGQESMCRCH